MFKYILVISLILFTGCSSKNDFSKVDKKTYTTSVNYDMISKDAILEAAKKAFIFTNKDFVIDSYRNSLSVRKTNINVLLFNPTLIEDTWFFDVREIDNKSLASLYIKRIEDLDSKTYSYLKIDNHDIFWKRLDFFLSIESKWFECILNSNDLFGTNSFCDLEGKIDSLIPNDSDRIKDIFIFQRQNSKNIVEINDDILLNDNFSLTRRKADILEKEDKIDTSLSQSNEDDIKDIKEIDDILDKIKKDTNDKLNK